MLISVTLGLVIIGYVWGHPRTVPQSMAVAALLGIIAIPITSFVVEMILAPDPMLLLRTGRIVDCENCEQGSSVDHLWLIATWVVIGGAAFLTDRRNQR